MGDRKVEVAEMVPNADVEAGRSGVAFRGMQERGGESSLAWKDLSLRIGKKQILDSVSGHVKSGEMCALMGPSGSGKTSTLNCIAGRVLAGRGKKLTGKVAVNGRVIVPKLYRTKIAFVLQQDSLYATATCREALEFSAKLRLPSDVPASKRKEIVDDLIESLGLSHVQDTMIGSDLVRGLSGGEKKRVSIGVELVTRPSILFADEPTSGLDSFSASKVMHILKNVAAVGRCAVVCTIHQPSTEIFELFDTALVLKQGRVLYNGAVAAMPDQLAAMGFPVPPRTNVADFVLLTAQTHEWSELKGYNLDTQMTLEDAKALTAEDKAELQKADRREARKPGLCVQVGELFKRELRNTRRDKGSLIANVVITALLNALYAGIFSGVANINNTPYSFAAAQGALTLVCTSAMFGSAQGPLLTFPLERAVTVRELQTGTFSPVAYFASKFTVELPTYLLTATITLCVAYWWTGYNGSFLIFLLEIWLVMLAASSYAFVLGAAVSDAKQAQQFAPLILVPQLLFSGLFLPISMIPAVLRWVQYVCALVYGVKLVLINEFNDNPACDAICRQQVLVQNSADPDHVWLYILVLGGIAVGFRLISLCILILRARWFAN